jgi:hypothetical protein
MNQADLFLIAIAREEFSHDNVLHIRSATERINKALRDRLSSIGLNGFRRVRRGRLENVLLELGYVKCRQGDKVAWEK